MKKWIIICLSGGIILATSPVALSQEIEKFLISEIIKLTVSAMISAYGPNAEEDLKNFETTQLEVYEEKLYKLELENYSNIMELNKEAYLDLQKYLESYLTAEYCMPTSGGYYKGKYYCPADCKLNWGDDDINDDENYCPDNCRITEIPYCKKPIELENLFEIS